MSFTDVLTAISTMGFPIAACCAMAYFFLTVINNYRAALTEINAEHKEEMQAMTSAVNNNTLVIQKLVDRMDGSNESKIL